jgi:hypothetical protein
MRVFDKHPLRPITQFYYKIKWVFSKQNLKENKENMKNTFFFLYMTENP